MESKGPFFFSWLICSISIGFLLPATRLQYGFDECMDLSFSPLISHQMAIPATVESASCIACIAVDWPQYVIQVAAVDSAANGLHLKILPTL